MEELGQMQIIPPSSSIDTTPEIEQEGKRIAKLLDAKYIGYNHGFFWFNDNTTDSSYIAKDMRSAIIKRNIVWKNFQINPQYN